MWRQVGVQAQDFLEVGERFAPRRGNISPDAHGSSDGIKDILQKRRRKVVTRLVLLIVTVIPIVLLSHDMATLQDDGLGRVGAPIAFAGVLTALIVFLPESITAIRAALAVEIQRANNLCHGALVSTVGLTIPVVLIIGIATGQTVTLAESPANLLMLV